MSNCQEINFPINKYNVLVPFICYLKDDVLVNLKSVFVVPNIPK